MSTQQKRKKPEHDSPDKQVISCLIADVCNHCNKKCSPKGEALQCDLCGQWVHASCEGIKRDQYRQFSQLAASLQNISYYCKLNDCTNRVKVIVGEWIHSKSDSTESSHNLRQEQEVLSASIQNIATKIQELSSSSTELSTKVDRLQEQFQATQAKSNVSNQCPNSSEASSAALRAIEEIADREHRKNNIIVYNLLEGANRDADRDSASVLLNSILEHEVNITKLFRLGRKNSKNRPLLIGLDSEDTKMQVLAVAPRLRLSKQFPNVYISPDRTKVEQQQHKELVALLRQRREKGERNIVIRNGRIVTYHPRPQQTTVVIPQQPLILLSPAQTATTSNDMTQNSS